MHFPNFSSRSTRWKSSLVRGMFVVGALFLLAWVLRASVFAERSAIIFVFPTSVSGEGWEHPELAVAQDLSASAQYADFSSENSARVRFGAYLLDIGTSSEVGETIPAFTPSGNETIPEIIPVGYPSQEGIQEFSPADPTHEHTPIPEKPSSQGIPPIEETEPIVPIVPSIISPITPSSPESLRNIPKNFSRLVPFVAYAQEETETTSSAPAKIAPELFSLPQDVAICATLETACHIIELSGFGVSGGITSRPIQKVTMNMSFAAKGGQDQATNDRIVVRVYHDKAWEYLGEFDLGKETSNEKQRGYLSFDVPSISRWGDLVGAKIAIEYVRESSADAEAYLDGAWFSIEYLKDDTLSSESVEGNVARELSGADVQTRKERRNTLVVPGSPAIRFDHETPLPDSRIVLRGDKEVYRALGTFDAYVLVANDEEDAQDVRLQFYAPPDARVVNVSRWSIGIPYTRSTVSYGTSGYFCESVWVEATSTIADSATARTYACGASGEERVCDALNDDGTNCLVDGTKAGVREEIAYRDGWETEELGVGSISEESGFIERIIRSIISELPEGAIPSDLVPGGYLKKPLLLEPGQGVYLRVRFEVPPNSRGNIYIEAQGESGAFGVLRTGWSGSWNHRVPISFALSGSVERTSAVVPIDLARMPETFWGRVKEDGSDIRFALSSGREVPFWLSRWNAEGRRGTAWVRVPISSTDATTTIHAYYDNPDATELPEGKMAFRTDDLEPRYIIFGAESQRDMTVELVALARDVRVAVGNREPQLLNEGEHAVIYNVRSGEVIRADGPVSGDVESVGDTAVLVPLALAGTRFAVPPLAEGSEIAFATIEDSANLFGVNSDAPTEIIPGSIVSTPLTDDRSTILESDAPVLAVYANGSGGRTGVVPATDEPLYALKEGRGRVVAVRDGTSFVTRCERGERSVIDGRLRGAVWEERSCVEGDPMATEAVSIIPLRDYPVGAIMEGSETGAPLSVIPESQFDSVFALTDDAIAVVAVCSPRDGELTISLTDIAGQVFASTTCAARGSNPGKAVFFDPDRPISAGTIVRSSDATPFAAFAWVRTSSGSAYASRVKNLWGPLMSRGAPAGDGLPVIGEEEFVIPGEHRAIDENADGTAKKHVNDYLANTREFSSNERPTFRFRYAPQSSGIVTGLRDAFGVRQFTVSRVEIVHQGLGVQQIPISVTYGEGNEWSATIDGPLMEFRPGKYTLRATIEEGAQTYVDEFDFYWGLLAMNYRKSVYVPNEDVEIDIGAISDTGNTICDADLRLWVTDPSGRESVVPVVPSGKCSGNNVVDVPDYSAVYRTNATGTYALRLIRLDSEGNLASRLDERLEVREHVPYVIERVGPTRIYPLAQYDMRIRVRALQDFSGTVVERMPNDFLVIDRGNADLEISGEYLTATWNANMKAGETVEYTYRFDAPNLSPYLYLLGPIEMRSGTGESNFIEARAWQIASDAAGKMLIFWDSQERIPSGWTCVSCGVADPFYRRFVMGSSTYNVSGGTATHTPTAAATVYTTGSSGVGPITTNNTINAPLSHSHTLTPQISGASNFPAYYELRILQAVSAGDSVTLPTGAIAMFDIASSSLPSGWYRFSAMDGRYPLAASTTNVTGGSNTHSHTATGTLTAPPESGLRSQNGVPNGATNFAHTHTLTPTSTNVLNHEPPYVEVLFARLSATSSPSNYMITMWDDTPPDQWTVLSGPGGAFEEKFLKASTTYGGSGGSLSHQHADIIGATTSVASILSNYTASANNGQAPAAHIHFVDITGFSTDAHVPPYKTAIFAKRLVNVSTYDQVNFRFYANTNGLTPSDPWPSGGADLGERDSIDTPAISSKPADILRIRMALLVGNSTSTVARDAFKLQYAASTDCPTALNWTDVGAIADPSALWRGYNNTGATNNATLPSTLLSTAQRAESYVEENNSTGTPTQIGIGEQGEWDWVVQQNLAAAGTNYCFRMVRSDGTPLDTYTEYPSVLTNAAPEAATLSRLFDNEKVGTTTPLLTFSSVDTETDDLDYQIQVSTSKAFGTTVFDVDSTDSPEYFENVSNPSNKAPFYSGDTIRVRVTPALTNGTTYWWRVRAKDTNGSNAYGPWSSPRSFTVDTTVTTSTWFQTTSEQFQTDEFIGTNSSSSNAIMLNTGSTTGNAYSSPIQFSLADVGTVYGSLSWVDDETNGNLRYQIEYYSATSTWMLVPDSALPGNSSSFGTSPVSLISIDPNEYPIIRIRANFTDIGGTPKMNDWTLTWGYNVNTPTLYTPFDNAIVASTSPYLEFVTTDPNNDLVTYQVSWSTDPNFTSSTTRSSDLDAGFRNISYATDTDPFNSGERIRYVFQPADALTASTTYFWRVRARDPFGGNTWSFWSAPKSFTVGLSHRSAAWYQTVDGQFRNDNLTGVETYGANRLRVATQTSAGMIAYGESGTQFPRFRIWDGSAWSSEGSANSIGATLYWAVLRSAPITGKFFLGTIGSNNDSMVQIYDGTAWGAPRTISPTLSNSRARGLDIAFESVSGKAMVVSCDGDADPIYSIYDGSTWATGTVDISSSNNCEWIRLASKPNDNEIVLMERDTGNRYEAQVWNATTSTWGNATTLGRMQELAHEGMALSYNASGSLAVIVASNYTNNSFVWKSWNGSTWSATTTYALTNDFDWGNMVRDVRSGNMHVCGVDSTNNITRSRWTGATFAANSNAVTTNSRVDRRTDCVFETTAGRSGYILQAYGDTTANQTRYTVWSGAAWSAGAQISTIANTVVSQLRRMGDGRILGAFYDAVNLDLVVSNWDGTTWSAASILESSPSVTTAPYGEPFMIAAQEPSTRGTAAGQGVAFSDGNSPAWKRILWTDTKYGGSNILYQVEYQVATGTWALIPDSVIPGNSTGTSTSPIALTNVDPTVYSTIRLVGNFSCDALLRCPYLDDWTVEWAEGIKVSGTAKREDLSTAVTSGTVAIAVNGTLQAGKTGTIAANGQWEIDNVTVFPGDIVTVWIDGAAEANEAVAVAKYTISGDLGGISLNERWLTLGSASTTGASLTLSDVSKFDNSVSGDEDIFHDVSAGGDLTVCSTGACSNAGLYLLAGNTFRPNSSAAKTINTYNLRIAGTLIADGNTIKVGGDWRNLGTFTANTSTVVMNATSTIHSIDQTGATLGTFYNLTFGETGSTATWNLVSAATTTGTLSISFGTTSPVNAELNIQGDMIIGSSGTFKKGNATTTFSGATTKTLTDNTASKQDLGKVLIDGSAKTLVLGSDIRVTDITIGTDDTLDVASSWTVSLLGNWRNQGVFMARTGTVAVVATSTGYWIDHGASNFYNLTFNGPGGEWSFRSANATVTNTVTILAGTATLPSGTFAIGGSFDNSGGTFSAGSGTVRMTSSSGGRTIRAGSSPFFDLQFAGTGSWTMVDTNATATGAISLNQGSVTLPAGTLAVGTDFVNSGGTFTSGSGIVRFNAASGSRSIRANGSSFSTLQIAGAGTFTFADANATATADVSILAGTLVFPTSNFAIGGSFSNASVFTSGSAQTLFYATSGTKTINSGQSSFSSVSVTGAGNFTFIANATATGAFSLTQAGSFTVNPGVTLAIGGPFTNLVGGAATTWTGSTLYLYSGTSFTVNTKTAGGDAYGTLKTGANTQVRLWNSSASTYVMHESGSVYSQDHAAVDGDLYIFGNYSRTSGTDYWSYATDFDGTALSGNERAVNVRFAADATSTYSGATLQILGGATATTTIDHQTTGNYGIVVNNGMLNAQYYQVRNANRMGIQILGSTTVTSLRDGDFELNIAGGTMLTVSSTTIDANPAAQIYSVRFATSTGITSGSNVTEIGVPSSFWRFRQHSGNLSGEAYDVDPGGNPGYIRWDDSNFVISISGNVYSDAGVTPMGSPTCDNVTNVVRVKVDGAGDFAAPCNPVTGAYTVTGVTFSGDTVMTVYLDTGGGARAVNVTRSAAADLTGIHLYQNRVIVRHEDTTPMSIAAMNAYDFNDDSDIPFVVTLGSPNTLTVMPDTEFWIWSGKTFVPGGNITLNSGGSGNFWDGKFHIDNNATFTAQGTETHSIGGNWQSDSGATFTSANSTFIFTATTTGKLITSTVPITFHTIRFNGLGGAWSVNQDIQVNGAFLVDAGTVGGAANITVNGTTVTGSGSIMMTGGTFQLASGGTFGGPTDWSFWNLTFAGNGATTTKTGSSTVTVGRVLSVFTNHTLRSGTSSAWVLAGSSTPFSLAGTVDTERSVWRYAATGTTLVTPATYWRLWLAPNGSGSPTFTMGAGVFAVRDSFVIGDGTNGVSVDAATSDPTISVGGDVHIRTGATFVGSDSGEFIAYRNWQNDGTFISSSGTVTFSATSTGRTIVPGASSFGSVLFNSPSGGWTILGNATATGAFTLSSAQSFTQASGTILAVGGSFTNYVGGSATTWDGTTLKLYSGTNFTVNSKQNGADRYDTLEIAANTAVRLWNSSATTTTTGSNASLYSQDHAGVDGDLYIWGAYTRSSGADYWSYNTDFDGASLSTSSPRAVNVRLAPSASMTFSGGELEILGVDGATTTVDRQSTGNYGFTISGGSTTIRHLALRNADVNGLRFSGTPIVNLLHDSDFELGVTGGSAILVAATTIDANPLKTFFRNRFATSTAAPTGYNVQASGVAASAWRFNLHYGAFSGEAYDLDPGGDPGYIIWDDSAANITISGKVYSDEGKTPIGAPTCDGVTQNVRLRVQGSGNYTSACNAGTGAYSISGVIFNPGDTITVFLDTNGGARAVNVTVDPATNIFDMDLYQNRIIVRHEDTNPMTISDMNAYDQGNDSDIPYTATVGSPDTLVVRAGTGLIVWDNKTFDPQGNITLHSTNSFSPYDGTLRLAPGAMLIGSGRTHTIGGQFLADSGAILSVGSTTMIFTATTTGKLIAASSTQTFGSIWFTGAGGGWNLSGVGTSTGSVIVQNGSVTLPASTLSIGASFDVSGSASFDSTGNTLRFYATSTGQIIRGNGSSFGSLVFNGSGGSWRFVDTNASTTGSMTIEAGTVNLPSGTLAIGTDYLNTGGTFGAGSGILRFTSSSGSRFIRFGGSAANDVQFAGSSTFAFLDSSATSTGDFLILQGTTTFPERSLSVGGNFLSLGSFLAGTSTISFTATTGAKTVDPRASSFGSVIIAASASGGIIMSGNATATDAFSIRTAPFFTQLSGTTLAVGGVFTNAVGGSITTWTGSTLSLFGGSFSMNSKTTGGDGYEYIRISSTTQVRSWNSSSTAVFTDASSSWYSQDHGATDGLLHIYGNYSRTSGTDYWSYATDFDGTVLSGGSRRQVNVRFEANATSTFSNNSTLEIIGAPTATTTIDRISSGSYGVIIDASTLSAQYHAWQNLGRSGLELRGTTTLASFINGDFTLSQNGGSMITIASTSIAQNASQTYTNFRFATSSGVTSGANVRRVGTTTNAITFQSESGNFSGEAFDEDGDDACGSIRWTDSSCLFVDQSGYRFRNDDGGEGAPDTQWYNSGWTKRQRVRITNTSSTTLSDVQVKLNVQYDSDMQSDFDDLRFTDSGGTTSLPYWIQDFVTAASSSVWVRVPSIPASSFADIYMYYGNGTANGASSGTTTFKFFDDFEDGNITEYSGDTSLFEASTGFNYERTRGLDASTGNEGAQATDGIYQDGLSIGQGTTFRFFQYINMATGASDEPCVLFAVGSPGSGNQNYGVCLQPFGSDKVVIAKNVSYNGRSDGATVLATKNVTYSTGWYEVHVDWLASGRIDVNVKDSTGAFFASTTAVDSTYTSGGIGFTFWGQHGGWDVYSARTYYPSTPTATFGVEQSGGGATWKAAENATLIDQPINQNVRLRFSIKNSGTDISGQNFRLQVAPKATSPNCESVQAASYQDVPTTTGGCGSSPSCMVASPNYTDKASTTQLMSVPANFLFSQGQILEDPSNQTGNVSISSGYVTEVEYGFQMTAFATQNAYCFRVTNGTTPLDNYSKVAELRVLQVPSISNWSFNMDNDIALTEGTTTRIFATGTVTDFNGYTDIVAATSTFYRSGVTGGRFCLADENNCYQIASTSCNFLNCSGNSCELSCSAFLQYFAEPTDSGSIYDAQFWDAFVDVWDTSGSHATASSTQDVYTLRALTVPSEINYGALAVGSDTGNANATTSVTNTGNDLLNILLSGTNLTAGSSTIPVYGQKYATTTFTYGTCTLCNKLLSTTTQALPLGVLKPTTTTAISKDVFWGIFIPSGTAATTHTGVNTFLAN